MGEFKESNYYKSKKHIENAKNAGVKGNLRIQELKEKRIKEYYDNPKYCELCGRPIVYEKKNEKKFCNSSCAATFNNKKRVLTEETKQKISIGRKNNIEITKKEITRKCVNCNEIFIVKRSQKNVLSKAMCCSKECAHESMKINCSLAMKERVKNGVHIGWKTRNVISYPEKFFMKVLDNNGIKYFHNHVVKKRDLGLTEEGNYFLDFFINDKNIDLEIDGKQHMYEDRHQSDCKRDKILVDNGYNIYRIKWENISTDEGKKSIKLKINNFLSYYKNLQIGV